MELLYSNILPLAIKDGRQTVVDRFREEMADCSGLDVAVGYVSKAALEELDALVIEYGLKHINLVMGMYYTTGMPEGSYRTALALNKKWQSRGLGEVRLTNRFNYHGKLYVFYKDSTPKSAIIGSANLSVIKPEASNFRQYEVAGAVCEPSEVAAIAVHVKEVLEDRCSVNISNATQMPIVRELNTSLQNIENVERIPEAEVEIYKKHRTDVVFVLPIKVPAYDERHMDDGKHFTKSNLNVSYAAPRYAKKARDWYETQLTVNKNITLLPGYPVKNVMFFVVTDDGYTFKAHTTSDGNKQLSAVGDELILGRWIKGRLVAAGLVTPVNNTQLDSDRKGMITKEMLKAYGCDRLVLTKTDQKKLDNDGNILDVWYISFEASK